MSEDQGPVEAFLASWRDRGAPGSDPQTIVTHISKIFLSGGRALKMKRAVRFPYVDFSTPELRLADCQRELALNQRAAPGLYLRVHTIVRRSDGALAFDGDGALIDAVVEMRRFDQAGLFDTMARKGGLTADALTQLARVIANFHASAPVSSELGGAIGMREVLDINDKALRETGLVSGAAAGDIAHRFRAALGNHRRALDERLARGMVRRCHGDLALRNICMIEGVPTLFDCLEFDDGLATIDVLYDLAFPIMDLLSLGLPSHANVLMNRYFDETADINGAGLLPFFTAVRAAVSAHVAAARAKRLEGSEAALGAGEARGFLDLAMSLLSPPQPLLIAIGGRSGSGKSTVAAALAPAIGLPPGARVLSSDRIRKRLHGARAEQRLPAEAYQPEVSTRVYSAMRDEAFAALSEGCAVVADAVFDRLVDRAAIEAIGGIAKAPFSGIWLEAPADVLEQRVEARVNDPSDATVDVLRGQLRNDHGEITWRKIDARRAPGDIAADALKPPPQAGHF